MIPQGPIHIDRSLRRFMLAVKQIVIGRIAKRERSLVGKLIMRPPLDQPVHSDQHDRLIGHVVLI